MNKKKKWKKARYIGSLLTLGFEKSNLHCIDAINIDSNPIILDI